VALSLSSLSLVFSLSCSDPPLSLSPSLSLNTSLSESALYEDSLSLLLKIFF
jgi:hypothetical protein